MANHSSLNVVHEVLDLLRTGRAKNLVAHCAQVPFVLPVPGICEFNDVSQDLLLGDFGDVAHGARS